MPFWKDYVEAKPEVDDDDLPLPEHRIFDDEGYLKEKITAATAAALRTSPSRAGNAKKSPTLSPKKRAELLKSVGAKPTTPVKVIEAGTDAPAAPSATPSRSPSARKSATRAKSPSSVSRSPRASRGNATASKPTPKKASPKKAAAKRTTPAKSTPSRSPARTRARSPSPKKPKASPKAASRAKRSRSKSGSRKAAQSKTPSPKWTVSALKDFAKENSIVLGEATKKSEILDAIKNSA